MEWNGVERNGVERSSVSVVWWGLWRVGWCAMLIAVSVVVVSSVVMWGAAMCLHPPLVSPSIGGAHLHRQALEQGPVVLAGRPQIPIGSFAGELLEDGTGFRIPCSAGLANHRQKGDPLCFTSGGSVQVGPLGL